MCTYWNKVSLTKLKSKKNKRIDSIGIGLASPKEIRRWGERRLPNGTLLGQVEKDHTVDYESLKPIEGGLFCERIFGPVEDFYCSCERRGEKNEKFCPNCEVEFTKSRVRRTRMGYIPLAVPVAHVWYLRGRPSYIANLIGKSRNAVDRLAYGETLCESFIGNPDNTFFKDSSTNLIKSEQNDKLTFEKNINHPSTSQDALYVLAALMLRNTQNTLPCKALPKNTCIRRWYVSCYKNMSTGMGRKFQKGNAVKQVMKHGKCGTGGTEFTNVIHNLSSFHNDGKQNWNLFSRQMKLRSSFSQKFAQTTTNQKTSLFCELFKFKKFKLQNFANFLPVSLATWSRSPIKTKTNKDFVKPFFPKPRIACFSTLNPRLNSRTFISTNSVQNQQNRHTQREKTPKKALDFVGSSTKFMRKVDENRWWLTKPVIFSLGLSQKIFRRAYVISLQNNNVSLKIRKPIFYSFPLVTRTGFPFNQAWNYKGNKSLSIFINKGNQTMITFGGDVVANSGNTTGWVGIHGLFPYHFFTLLRATIPYYFTGTYPSGMQKDGMDCFLRTPKGGKKMVSTGKVCWVKSMQKRQYANKVDGTQVVQSKDGMWDTQKKLVTAGKYNKFHTLPLFSTFVYKEWSHRFSFLEYFVWSARNDDVTLPFYIHQQKETVSHTTRKNSLSFVKNKIISCSSSVTKLTKHFTSTRSTKIIQQSFGAKLGLMVCENHNNGMVGCTFFHPKKGFFASQRRFEGNLNSFLRISIKRDVQMPKDLKLTTSLLPHITTTQQCFIPSNLSKRIVGISSKEKIPMEYFPSLFAYPTGKQASSASISKVIPSFCIPSFAMVAPVRSKMQYLCIPIMYPMYHSEAMGMLAKPLMMYKSTPRSIFDDKRQGPHGMKMGLMTCYHTQHTKGSKPHIGNLSPSPFGVASRCEAEKEVRNQQNHLWGKIDDTQQFPRLAELLSFTGGTALRYLLSRFDLILLGKFVRYELKNLEFKVNSLLALKILTYSQGLLLGKLAKRRSKQIRRLKLLELFQFQKSNPEWMILSVLPVLPPDLRPILRVNDDFVVASDLNRLYQTVLRRNNTIRERLDDPLPCPESGLFRQRSLQKAVDGLLENGKGGGTPLCASKRRPLVSLSHVLKGKKGLFRQHLLGKRVDYSGRSVIVVGPKLGLHECGLPKEMAMELFQPFLLHKLKVKGLASSNTIARQMIQQEDPVIWHILKQLVYEHPVLLNRAPTLHRLGIQAFQPRLVSGRAILLHPLVCNGFNADFDGDQMAVHVPLSFQARAEAWKIMWSKNNLLSPATGQPILMPSQDMVLGCYYLSVSVPRVLGFLTPFETRVENQDTVTTTTLASPRGVPTTSAIIPNKPSFCLAPVANHLMHIFTGACEAIPSGMQKEGMGCFLRTLHSKKGGKKMVSNTLPCKATKVCIPTVYHSEVKLAVLQAHRYRYTAQHASQHSVRNTTTFLDTLVLIQRCLQGFNTFNIRNWPTRKSYKFKVSPKTILTHGRSAKLYPFFWKIDLFGYTRDAVNQLLFFPRKRFISFSFFTYINLKRVPILQFAVTPRVVVVPYCYDFFDFLFNNILLQRKSLFSPLVAVPNYALKKKGPVNSFNSNDITTNISYLNQNKEHYFSNLEDSLVAYFQGRLQTHTPFWVRIACEATHTIKISKKKQPLSAKEHFSPLFVERAPLDSRPKNSRVEPRWSPFLQPRYGSSESVCTILFQNSHFKKPKSNVIVESNDALESPLELRLSADGNLVKISPTFQNHYNYNATILDQCNEQSISYMRTTAGRVVINKTLF